MPRAFGSSVPAYVSVYDSLYSDLINGVFLEGDPLPSESALANKYGVSRNTLRQALAILDEDGLIEKSQGKDTLVKHRDQNLHHGKIVNPMTEMCRVPIERVSLDYNYGPPTEISQTRLGLSRSDIVLAGTTLCFSGGIPVGYSFTQVPVSHFDRLSVDASSDSVLEELLLKRVFEKSVKALMTVKQVSSNQMESQALEIPEETPLLLMEWVLYGATREAFARVKFYLRSEFYNLHFQI